MTEKPSFFFCLNNFDIFIQCLTNITPFFSEIKHVDILILIFIMLVLPFLVMLLYLLPPRCVPPVSVHSSSHSLSSCVLRCFDAAAISSLIHCLLVYGLLAVYWISDFHLCSYGISCMCWIDLLVLIWCCLWTSEFAQSQNKELLVPSSVWVRPPGAPPHPLN